MARNTAKFPDIDHEVARPHEAHSNRTGEVRPLGGLDIAAPCKTFVTARFRSCRRAFPRSQGRACCLLPPLAPAVTAPKESRKGQAGGKPQPSRPVRPTIHSDDGGKSQAELPPVHPRPSARSPALSPGNDDRHKVIPRLPASLSRNTPKRLSIVEL